MTKIDVVLLGREEISKIIADAIGAYKRLSTIDEDLPRYPTISQASKWLGISHSTLRGYIESGHMKAVYLKDSSTLRVDRDELSQLIIQ